MLRTCGLVIAVATLIVACGGGDSTSSSEDTPVEPTSPPQALQYGLGSGEVGVPFGPYAPSVSGTVTAYSVTPPLPTGLMLDAASGVISGTPLARSSGTYTVSASNQSGSTTLTFSLDVFVPPTLAYTTPVTGKVGVALQLVPTLSGDADDIAILPPLPDGLALDSTTGIISGIPTRARVPAIYTVTAGNAGVALSNADLVLSVDPPSPGTAATGVFRSDTVIGLGYLSGSHSGITDKSGAFTYETGQGVTFYVGAVRIGTVPAAKPLVTPLDLVEQGTLASNRVLNVARFLMMLDQDGNLNNGIQISAAVTAAARSWAPVDFDTADLPTALGSLIQQANAADGITHVLTDAATAQTQLLASFYCTHSGGYSGTFAWNATPAVHTYFTANVFSDGGMHSSADAGIAAAGFDVRTNDGGSALGDATFSQKFYAPSGSTLVEIVGTFSDATYMSGTYHAAGAGSSVKGSFQAVGYPSVTSTYKFVGSFDGFSGPIWFYMDDSNQVSGDLSLAGMVSGSTFTGTIRVGTGDPYSHRVVTLPVSGTYSNSASGVTLDGQYTRNGVVNAFSSVGCRAN